MIQKNTFSVTIHIPMFTTQNNFVIFYFLGANFLEQVFWTTGYEYFKISISNLLLKFAKLSLPLVVQGSTNFAIFPSIRRKLTFTNLREKVSFVQVFIYLIMRKIGHILYFISHLFLFSVISYSYIGPFKYVWDNCA